MKGEALWERAALALSPTEHQGSVLIEPLRPAHRRSP